MAHGGDGIRLGFMTRLLIRLVAVAIVLAVIFAVVSESWGVLAALALTISGLAAVTNVCWPSIKGRFDDSPGLAAAVMVTSTVLGIPVLLAYERFPLVPKSRWMRLRITARRMKRRTRTAVDFHLGETYGEPVIPSLYLIFRRTAQAEPLRAHRQEHVDAYREQLRRVSFPDGALHNLYVGFVSKEEIRDGGGSFYFWREGPKNS